MIRGWDLILTWWRWLHDPQVGVSTPWGVVWAREITVFVPGLLKGMISDPGMGRYPHQMVLALRTPG